MLAIKVAYNNKCAKDIDNVFSAQGNPMFEFFNEDEPKELKKAWKYKGEAGARQVPFIGVYEDNRLIKAFYNEDKSYTKLFDWLEEYIDKHAFKGWLTVTKQEGNNNNLIPVNAVRSGYTKAFMEGVGLYISGPDDWFHTSVVTSIDWENKTFKTLNSTYSFVINEKEESKHQQEDSQDSQ